MWKLERYIFLFLLLLMSFSSSAQKETEGEVCAVHPSEDYGNRTLDSLEEVYGINKRIPERIRRPVLIALSAYPELKDVPIEFKEASIPTTMAARPILSSLWGDQGKRCYRILIDTIDTRSKGKLFHELPFEGRIGIMAHELAHVLDYESQTPGELFTYALRYAFEGGRQKLEERTDRIAVKRGFGWQLLAFKDHLKYCAELNADYAEYKERVYLSYNELLRILEEDPRYASREEHETHPSGSTSQ